MNKIVLIVLFFELNSVCISQYLWISDVFLMQMNECFGGEKASPFIVQ